MSKRAECLEQGRKAGATGTARQMNPHCMPSAFEAARKSNEPGAELLRLRSAQWWDEGWVEGTHAKREAVRVFP